MVAGLGVASLFSYAINYNSGGNDRATAISIAQQQLEQFRGIPFADASLNVTGSSGTVLTPNVVSNGRSYQVTKTVIGSNNDVNGDPTLKTIIIQVRPMGTGWVSFPVVVKTIRSATAIGIYAQ